MNRIILNQRLIAMKNAAVPQHKRNAVANNTDNRSFSDVLTKKSQKPEPVTSMLLETAIKRPDTVISSPTEDYAQNTSLKWYEGQVIDYQEMRNRMSGAIMVTIGENELRGLMEEIEKALAKGESYIDVLQRQFNGKNHQRGSCVYDTLFLDPNTGEILHASPYRGVVSHTDGKNGKICHSIESDNAVWDLAYDFQMFMKLRVFGETGNLSKTEIEEKIAEIKERQADKDYARYHMTGLKWTSGLNLQDYFVRMPQRTMYTSMKA